MKNKPFSLVHDKASNLKPLITSPYTYKAVNHSLKISRLLFILDVSKYENSYHLLSVYYVLIPSPTFLANHSNNPIR